MVSDRQRHFVLDFGRARNSRARHSDRDPQQTAAVRQESVYGRRL